jgi:hypothetical protein
VLIRFCNYGLLGLCFAVVWSAVTEKAWGKQRDWRLVGHTYLWMFPIYGLLAPLGEPVHNFLRPHFWLLWGLVYLIGIWLVEFLTGWLCASSLASAPGTIPIFRGASKASSRWNARRSGSSSAWASSACMMR